MYMYCRYRVIVTDKAHSATETVIRLCRYEMQYYKLYVA